MVSGKDKPPVKGEALREKLRIVSRQLRANVESARVLGSHRGEKGMRTELVLIEFLREMLPGRYGVARGEVVDSTGQVARQCDVVIYDALYSPLLLQSDTSSIFPAESVYAVIEVKPVLTRENLRKAVRALHSVKRLDRSATMLDSEGHHNYGGPLAGPPIFAAIFAMPQKRVKEWLTPTLHEMNSELPDRERVDCICMLDGQLVTHFAPVVDGKGEYSWWLSPSGGSARLGEYVAKEDTLLMFYMLLLHELNSRALFPPDLLQYLNHADLPGPRIYNAEAAARQKKDRSTSAE